MNDVDLYRRYIDYTNLQTNLTYDDVYNFCIQAKENNFYAVCLQPFFVPRAVQILKNSLVKVCSVVAFPYGATSLDAKLFEAEKLIKLGVDEIDSVMNIPAFINKEYKVVEEEAEKLVEICHSNKVILKVIIETGLLVAEEIAEASRLLSEIGVDFIKTSTGVVSRGAKIEDILIIKENVKNNCKIKASGGIRTLEQVRKFIETGASRIGTSSALEIFTEA